VLELDVAGVGGVVGLLFAIAFYGDRRAGTWR
jgi:hypothetical protein